jgi:hypothetical protein
MGITEAGNSLASNPYVISPLIMDVTKLIYKKSYTFIGSQNNEQVSTTLQALDV